jgi:hypothetical protein
VLAVVVSGGAPRSDEQRGTSAELANALTAMFRYPRIAALSLASSPWGPLDPDGGSRRADYNLTAGAAHGVQSPAQ